MEEMIKMYEEPQLVQQILYSDDYLKFIVNECTLNALNSKADYIMEYHKHIWKPLCIVYHPSIRVYDKIFYIDKKKS